MDNINKAHKEGAVIGLYEVAGVGERLDIDVMLMTQPDTFNLFLIALMELQDMKKEEITWKPGPGYSFTSDDIMSWYQIAGIHGLPAEDWAGEEDRGKTKRDIARDGDGYCAHSTPTFALWHRPYLAMLEQTIFRQIDNIAKRFSESSEVSDEDKQKYKAAAKKFRLPYWDYFRPRGGPVTFPGVVDGTTTTAPYDFHAPRIFTEKRVMVKRLPDNKLIKMPNPFFQFEFDKSGSERIDWRYSKLDLNRLRDAKSRTCRHGGSEPENTILLNRLLNSVREDQTRVCLALIEDKAYSNFKAFSTDGVMDPNLDPIKALRSSTGSIEGFHNDYHGHIGGFAGDPKDKLRGGHMGSVPVAGFDPIFWIHHCQIDRILAIWQAANSDDGDKHWFNELAGAEFQALGDASLHPFRKWPIKPAKEDRYWTSDSAKYTDAFGYTYSETAGGRKGDQVRNEFTRKYGWSRRLDVNEDIGVPPEDMQPLDVSKAQVFHGLPSKDLFRPLIPPSIQPSKEQIFLAASTPSSEFSQEWYIDVVVERMALNGSYTIFYIIGDVDGHSGMEWSSLPGFVGVSHIFTSSSEICENCADHARQVQLVTSTTPMTSLLLDYVKIRQLGSLAPRDVERFLIENLKWRVQTIDGKVIDPRDLDRHHTMKLGISRKIAPMPGQDGEVRYTFHPEIIDTIINNSSPEMTSLTTHPLSKQLTPTSNQEIAMDRPKGLDRTDLYADKLAELVTQNVSNPLPAENAINARLTGIDGTGTAILASKIKTTSNDFGGFALVVQDDAKYNDFHWLQFITRQLVVDDAAKTGSLVNKASTPAYQLVDATGEVKDFASGAGASNWNTCWGVDSALTKGWFADTYEFAKSDDLKITAILDPPSVLMGKIPGSLQKEYKDAPDGLVNMKTELADSQGISRAYFSDYLLKKVDGDRYRIYARFDLTLTWNAREADKKNFTLNTLASTETNALLACHMAALRHVTTPGDGTAGNESFETFRSKII
ncbi:tyrosinase precursor (monophenol monooxygenase) [Fusarium circinatum]|uniref:tyrosinase n=1 Tax=Fusarium circinatum TaxID=48490 RepID=A0A8H5U0D3_FUSCI|nr:tyrosinase precursor (monophenol monooxygenase) [Fusarium circinatum]